MAKKEIDVRHQYDRESDVLYVRFGEQEPTYVENLDDFVLIEIGWFSGLPRGVRLIGPKYHKITSVQLTMVVKQIQKQVRELMEHRRQLIKQQEPMFANFCNTLPQILEMAY